MYQIFNKLHQNIVFLLLCLPIHKKQKNKKAANIFKRLDFVDSLLKIENEVAIQLLWGVETLTKSGKHQPKMMYSLIYYGRGDCSVCSELKFKDCYSRLLAVFLTPRLPMANAFGEELKK